MNQMNKLIKDILTLIVVSTVLGISAQAVLPNGIGLRTEITVIGDDSTGVAVPAVSINPNGEGEAASNISLNNAYSAFESNAALFIDARSPEDFGTGHITRAINLPVHAFMDSLPYLEKLDPGRHIITYCDGEDCNASIDLAADLKMMGFANVNFFFGGWQEWRDAGYPIESSP
ncbi:MAG: rhodanese-like domain-containing protein [Candidatus Marinimicrobia bacterium]|jgi:rhodanese-related sulfurtransferase|nr:rhodanese-like domain-containing protein [Candidatus Neomarinimicrobiota bacterium]MBT5998913.1 rhodanese-like domain-containing protein [Candidatus Neomarinimicrobiota bacterium]MBT6555790.1 rhodanese-like domain-containing protein [Candidatus Neomarinimicrobiota bacterium]MBT6721451.1 rhodanese-like domain-containing protein [Candidatus Neomarinimicrobiota bacterium]MBT6945696.1 rhodanese-like domain-containing protein [Candidatus Neomarinimicrobiota bacterium]